MGITLRQLEIFAKVAETQHITRASEKLFVSQSTVSMAISELEKETGGILFERYGRRLVINERGRLLLPHAQEMLSKADNVEKMLKESMEEPVGILEVGASTTIGNYLLPRLIGQFTRKYPKAQVVLHIGNTQQIEKDVQKGNLDLGLIEGPSHLPELDSSVWREDELVVIAGPEHPWAKSGKVSKDMLAKAQWIIREMGSGTREVFEIAMSDKVGSFRVGLELGHTEAIKKAVEAGLGVSCLSRLAVQREIDNKWLIEIKTPLNLKRNFILLTNKNKYHTRLFNTFINLLKTDQQ